MPRTRRNWEPNAIHHAVVKAHSGADIFADGADRAWVIERARTVFDETGATCLGWAVLSNHFHVLVRCDGPPGRTFSRLNTALAWRVRRDSGGSGAVLQNRFWSEPCEDEAALVNRLAYVIGNPVHHGVVPSISALRTYEWSGLGEILGLREPRWTDPRATLELLDTCADRARDALLGYLEARAAEWSEDGGNPDEDRGLRWTPESSEDAPPPPDDTPPAGATRATDARAESSCERTPRPDSMGLRNELDRQGWSVERLISVACEISGARERAVREGTRTAEAVVARSIAAHVACDVVGIPMVTAAPVLGVVPSTLVPARRRGRRFLAELGLPACTVLERSRSSANAAQAGPGSVEGRRGQ